jgi:hypothetical protein
MLLVLLQEPATCPLHYHRNACRRFHKETFFDRIIVLNFLSEREIEQFGDTRYLSIHLFSSMPLQILV